MGSHFCAARLLRAAVVLFALALVPIARAQSTDAVYVDANGNVGVGTSTPTGKLHVTGFGPGTNGIRMQSTAGAYANIPNSAGDIVLTAETSQGYGRLFFNSNISGSTTQLAAVYPTEPRFRVWGDIRANDFIVASSKRWKQDITPVGNAVGILNQLRPVSYRWNEKAREAIGIRPGDEKRQIGFIAEEVAEVLPEIVSVDEATNEVDGVSYGQLIPVLVEAIQEQQAQVEAQQAQIEALKTEIASLKAGHAH